MSCSCPVGVYLNEYGKLTLSEDHIPIGLYANQQNWYTSSLTSQDQAGYTQSDKIDIRWHYHRTTWPVGYQCTISCCRMSWCICNLFEMLYTLNLPEETPLRRDQPMTRDHSPNIIFIQHGLIYFWVETTCYERPLFNASRVVFTHRFYCSTNHKD